MPVSSKSFIKPSLFAFHDLRYLSGHLSTSLRRANMQKIHLVPTHTHANHNEMQQAKHKPKAQWVAQRQFRNTLNSPSAIIVNITVLDHRNRTARGWGRLEDDGGRECLMNRAHYICGHESVKE